MRGCPGAALRRGLVALALIVAAIGPSAPGRAAEPAVVAEADWIVSLQLTSGPHAGMIAMNLPRSLCIPYFSNMAASGLASATLATGNPAYANAAWSWLNWYAAHMDASGFVTDYELRSGTWVSTGGFDSTDAYAATFLSAVRDTFAVTGDSARLGALWPAVRKATDAILATAAPGYLTYAKPGWNLKYAMDNAEVYDGWRAVAELAAVAGDAPLRALAEEWIAGMQISLASFWNEAAGAYDVALTDSAVRHPADWTVFYPSVTAQVWMINAGIVPSARAAALAARIEQTHPQWDDPSALDVFDPPEGREIRPVGWWPSFADAFTNAGMQARGLAGFTSMRDAAIAAGRAWPYHAGSAGRMIEFVVARPDTTITAGPAAFSADPAPAVAFTGTATAASFECSIDDGPFTSCASPHAWPGPADGPHVARVRALDQAGHADPLPAVRAWTSDRTAPSVRLTGAPPDPGPIGSAVFAFDGTDAITPAAALTFECSMDGAAFSACASPAAYPAIATGAHLFRVRSADRAGNRSPEASHGWFADSVAPHTTIASGPSGSVGGGPVTIAFDGSDDVAVAGFECRMGTAAWQACTSPVEYPPSGEGAFLFSVRAADAAGNRDATPATRSWFVDTSPPDTWIFSGPSQASSSTSARIEFSGSDTVSPSYWLTFECSLDEGAYQRCTSPTTWHNLAGGPHTVRVRAIDAAGNADPTPAILSWTIDAAPPVSSFTTTDNAVLYGAPPAFERVVRGAATDDGSGVRIVTVTFTSQTGGVVAAEATVVCEDGSRRVCTWHAAPPAQAGRYRVRVFAVDRAGGTESPGPAAIAVMAL